MPIRFELRGSRTLALWLAAVHGGGVLAAWGSALPAAAAALLSALAAASFVRGLRLHALRNAPDAVVRIALEPEIRLGFSDGRACRGELRTPPFLHPRLVVLRLDSDARPHRGPRAAGLALPASPPQVVPAPPSARGRLVSARSRSAFRRLSRLEGERRARTAVGESSRETAMRRDVAVHDAVRLLDLVPATHHGSGYDARGSGFRYRIAGCVCADSLVAAGAFRPGRWDRGLLVFMSTELMPLAIHELSREAARATRSVARLRGERPPALGRAGEVRLLRHCHRCDDVCALDRRGAARTPRDGAAPACGSAPVVDRPAPRRSRGRPIRARRGRVRPRPRFLHRASGRGGRRPGVGVRPRRPGGPGLDPGRALPRGPCASTGRGGCSSFWTPVWARSTRAP